MDQVNHRALPNRIGVFDSGVGGLTVVRALRRLLPWIDIIYLGDTARVPYGSKSSETVTKYARSCLNFLRSQGAELILIACNTASANALDSLQKESSFPVIGAVIPGALSAVESTKNNNIGVIGTLSTIQSGAYENAIAALNPEAKIYKKACPLLVPLVEEGWLHCETTETIIEIYLTPLFKTCPAIDVLVLACTHYPLLRNSIEKIATKLSTSKIIVVDSAESMAKQTKSVVKPMDKNMVNGTLKIFVTDATRMQTIGAEFLSEPISSFELVDL